MVDETQQDRFDRIVGRVHMALIHDRDRIAQALTEIINEKPVFNKADWYGDPHKPTSDEARTFRQAKYYAERDKRRALQLLWQFKRTPYRVDAMVGALAATTKISIQGGAFYINHDAHRAIEARAAIVALLEHYLQGVQA